MKTRDLLQCKYCKKDLEDFLALSKGEHSANTELALEQFAVFMELRRLKRDQTTSILSTQISSSFDHKMLRDPNIPQLIC